MEDLFRRYGASLQRFLTRRGARPDVAADLTQDAFLRLIQAGPAEGIQSREAYLFRIATNLAIDRHRREVDGASSALPLDDQPEPPDLAPSADAALLSREALAVLQRAVDDLPPRGREVFVLHKFEGLSYDEIAGRLGIAKNTVMVHMARSLAHCKRRLDAYRRDHE
ncbi:RNA polymerase sigma-70 factor (ECF subfamily) [Stella humosa]|uniref:RNA polymerase sigma-70 factor (ECF subfamily) n=1 Tax=Stella humosa TaxID=94 RepID=A0A3N1MDX7_9PROT|nr:RNA polymerase sigma-70 factor (ECF subfamily) [Stella humosa]BBK31867.1 DNA-directed RNA polymerase sigma-70 factor [Stella humosa]